LTPTLDEFFQGDRHGFFLRAKLPDSKGLFQQGIVDREIRSHRSLHV
jgi:hypothetical protein